MAYCRYRPIYCLQGRLGNCSSGEDDLWLAYPRAMRHVRYCFLDNAILRICTEEANKWTLEGKMLKLWIYIFFSKMINLRRFCSVTDNIFLGSLAAREPFLVDQDGKLKTTYFHQDPRQGGFTKVIF